MAQLAKWRSRYAVLTVLSLSWVVASTDRVVMSVAMPAVSAEFGLGPLAMGAVFSAFSAGYAIAQIPGGLLTDKLGIRRVATISILCWSVFTALTGVVTSFAHMLVIRFLFGLSEGAFLTCSFKTVAVWFPKRERATANAIKMASGPLGVALAPIAIVAATAAWGWRPVFIFLFLPGLLMAALFWRIVPDRSPVAEEADSPAADGDAGKLALSGAARGPLKAFDALKEPTVLKNCLVLFFFDIAAWGFATWLPLYLVKVRGFSMIQMGITVSLPHLAGAGGCIFGGWISERYFSRNRMAPIVMMQFFTAVLLYVTFTATSPSLIVVCLTLAGFCLRAFTAAFWAIPMNTVPVELMGVTSGGINMAGQIAGFVAPLAVGYLVQAEGGGFNLACAFLILCVLASYMIGTFIGPRAKTRQRPAAEL